MGGRHQQRRGNEAEHHFPNETSGTKASRPICGETGCRPSAAREPAATFRGPQADEYKRVRIHSESILNPFCESILIKHRCLDGESGHDTVFFPEDLALPESIDLLVAPSKSTTIDLSSSERATRCQTGSPSFAASFISGRHLTYQSNAFPASSEASQETSSGIPGRSDFAPVLTPEAVGLTLGDMSIWLKRTSHASRQQLVVRLIDKSSTSSTLGGGGSWARRGLLEFINSPKTSPEIPPFLLPLQALADNTLQAENSTRHTKVPKPLIK